MLAYKIDQDPSSTLLKNLSKVSTHQGDELSRSYMIISRSSAVCRNAPVDPMPNLLKPRLPRFSLIFASAEEVRTQEPGFQQISQRISDDLGRSLIASDVKSARDSADRLRICLGSDRDCSADRT